MKPENTVVTCEVLTYNAKEQLPKYLTVTIGGVKIPVEEFTIKKKTGDDYIGAGQHEFTLAGKGNVTGEVKVIYLISKAEGKVVWPTAGNVTHGMKLYTSELSGGSTELGTFSWANGNMVPAVGTAAHKMIFTPNDKDNYNWNEADLSTLVNVTVVSGVSGSDYDYTTSGGSWGEAEEADAGDVSEQLAASYLDAAGGSDVNELSIVFDVLNQPVDYEFMPILRDADGSMAYANELLVIAQVDEDGEVVTRNLRLTLAQIKRLCEDMGFESLIFRNGDADVVVSQNELLTGDIYKLAAYMFTTQEQEIELLDLDLDAMPAPAQLSAQELTTLWAEVRIDPVIITQTEAGGEIELDAWDVSVWLCSDYTEIDISALLPGLTVGVNVTGMFAQEDRAAFEAASTVSLIDLFDEKLLLESTLQYLPAKMPDSIPDEAEHFMVAMPLEEGESVWTDYISGMPLETYRNDALVSSYAGPGVYMYSKTE